MNVLAAPFLYVLPSQLEAFACFTTFIELEAPLYVRPTLEGVHSGLQVRVVPYLLSLPSTNFPPSPARRSSAPNRRSNPTLPLTLSQPHSRVIRLPFSPHFRSLHSPSIPSHPTLGFLTRMGSRFERLVRRSSIMDPSTRSP